MMRITFSRTLTRRISREIQRSIGSHPSIAYYQGAVPKGPDEPSEHQISRRLLEHAEVEALQNSETLPDMPKGASYWRLLDATGIVLMQGAPEGNGHE